MARPDSRVMALIGNGAQSEFQAMAFHRMWACAHLRLYDTDPRATAKLMRNLAALRLTDLAVTRCATAAEAVRGADIVTTATADKCNATILTPNMIEPGMHLNAVGGDCPGKTELHADILRAKDVRIVVEFGRRRESRVRFNNSAALGRSPNWRTYCCAGAAGAGRRDHEVTLFDSVGFALNDFSSLRYLQRLNAEQPDGGQRIDLIPELDDPKDLFAGLAMRLRPRAAGRFA